MSGVACLYCRDTGTVLILTDWTDGQPEFTPASCTHPAAWSAGAAARMLGRPIERDLFGEVRP